MAKRNNPRPVTKKVNENSLINNEATTIRTKKGVSPIFQYALFLGIISFCMYANTLQNGYALDDTTAIQQNVLVRKGITAIPELLTTPYHSGNSTNKEHGLAIDDQYRPLSLITFAIEFQLWGDNPGLSHFINISLYVGCVILFFLFLYRLFDKKRPLVSFIASLLFALHPIHTEVVANIKSRDELLCFFFGFLSLNRLIKYEITGNVKLLLGGLILYFLSLLSKETSITFLLIIPFIFFFYRNGDKKCRIYISVGSFLISVIYLVIRFSILTAHHNYNPPAVLFIDNELSAVPSFGVRLATEILILGKYLKLLIAPYPLLCDYSYNAIPFVNFSNIFVWLSSLIYLALAGCGIWLLIRAKKSKAEKQQAPLAFGIIFFLITISIFSNILFLLGSAMAERFMFFPSAGFCLMVAFIVEFVIFKSPVADFKELKDKKILLILTSISVLFGGITINRNSDWKDTYTLVSADSKRSAENSRLYYFAANEEMAQTKTEGIDPGTKKQMFEEGIMDYRKCLAIYPGFCDAQTNLANAFMFAMLLDSAEAHGKMAVKADPYNANALNTLANVYMANKEYSPAIKLLSRAIAIDDANTLLPFNIGICNMNIRNYDSAIYYFRKVINRDTENSRALQLMAIAFDASGKKDSASEYERIARKYDPGFSVNNTSR